MLAAAESIEAQFELVAKVASGAFGEVWRARAKDGGRVVAVKRWHAHLGDAGALARFAREARLLSQVRSEHVVGYVAHGLDSDQRPWLVTDWLDGEDLSTWRSRPGLTVADALEVVCDAARGLATLHAAGIVHRDIKPGNIFVSTRDGRHRGCLVDLGIAHSTGATVLTEIGSILGSPAYMSPEQVRGEPVDARADLWSLGVVLYELLAGDTPFSSSSAIATLGKVLLEPVTPIGLLQPDLPSALGVVLEKLLDRALESRISIALEVEQRLVTVLRDARAAASLQRMVPEARAGSLEIQRTEHVPAGERRLVALIFARAGTTGDGDDGISSAISSVGGRAERLQDAWLGGFGLSRARGDELLAAARAACQMRKRGAAVALVTGWADVRSGMVLAGQLIDSGADLLERARGGEVRVLVESVAQLENRFEVGRTETGEPILLQERRGSAANVGAPMLLGRVVPVVGRDKELRLLEAVVAESVEDRSARVALVIGEAGLGKSRVRHELVGRVRAALGDIRVVQFRAEAMLAEVPHALVVGAIREMIGLEEGETAISARTKVESYATEWNIVDPTVLAFVAEFLRVPSADEPLAAVRQARQDPSLMRQRTYDALAGVFRAASRQRPLLLMVEDLHWADRASVDLLGWLHDQLKDEAVVLLAFARPELFERQPSLWQGIARTELRLSPLSQRASEQLVSAALSISDFERRDLAARAGGNPLFLEELVRARSEGVKDLPQAVHAVLQVRLDALTADARRLAQAASVFGQAFWAEGAIALRAVPSPAAAFAELVRAEIVVPRSTSRFSQTSEYLFRHALVRDAAYAMLIEVERRELHARAASWLEGVGEADAGVVGQHFESGGKYAEAAVQYARAADRALAESAFEEAETYATRVLALQPAADVAARTLLLRADTRRAFGRVREMLEDARQARQLVDHDPAMQIRALSKMAEALHLRGDLDGADRTLRAVLEDSHASFLGARIQALLELAFVDLDAGRWAEAATLVDEALGWIGDGDETLTPLRLRALIARVAALSCLGEYGAAATAANVAVSAATAAGHRARVAEARAERALFLVRVGLVEQARIELDIVCEEARRLQVPYLEAYALSVLGLACAAGQDFDAAIDAQTKAAETAEDMGARQLVRVADARRAMHLLDRGGASDVSVVVEMVPELLADSGASPVLGCLLRSVLARAQMLSGDVVDALRESERAMDELRSLGTLDDAEEYVRLTHARVLSTAGRTSEAETVVYQARERLTRKAAKLVATADREAFLRGLPVRREILAYVLEGAAR